MAQEIRTETLAVQVIERTYRVECIAEAGSDYSIVVYRERLTLLPDGTILARDRSLPIVRRSVLQVVGDPDSMTLLGLVKTKADAWAAEDAAAVPLPS